MGTQQTLFKGENMEELLRNYFINLGYFVVRGIKYRFENNDITDIDLYLYGRLSSLARQRVNVDIKNKKTPQAFERILWVNGLMKLLNFDSCIVATTDQRPVIKSFGQMHKTTILDGLFLSKLRNNINPERMSEEEFISMFAGLKSYKDNKDWKYLYHNSKSRLLTEQDFSGFNTTLSIIGFFIERILTNQQKIIEATRMLYVIISHLLVIIDYILKDIVFFQQPDREKKLSDGFKYGNLGKTGVDKIVAMAISLSDTKSQSSIVKELENIPIDILKDYFSKNDITKNIFNWAKEFEQIAFTKVFISPNQLDSGLKGTLSMLLDFHKIERKLFFNSFSK